MAVDAAFHHVPRDRLPDQEVALQVRVEDAVPFILLNREERRAPQYPRVVDEDIDPPELRDHRADQPGNVRRARGVGLDCRGAPP